MLCVHGSPRRIEGRDLVSVGSAGKPKDGDPRAGYALIEVTDTARAMFPRVAYDAEAAARGVEATDLPHGFARRLRVGRG